MTDTSDPDYGKLTDASFERSRTRIGVPMKLPNPPHNLEVSLDGLAHFTSGYGDDNPLYRDPEYAALTLRMRDERMMSHRTSSMPCISST